MRNLHLTALEKAAVVSTAAAASFKVLLWSVGVTLASDDWWLPAAMWLFGLISFVAFELTAMAVVTDQRMHGRNFWGTIALIMASGIAAAIALHVAGVADLPQLHAGPAILLFFFGLHLSGKRRSATPDVTPDAAAAAARPPPMPQWPTIPDLIRAAAAAQPHASAAQIAKQLGTSADTVGRALRAESEGAA